MDYNQKNPFSNLAGDQKGGMKTKYAGAFLLTGAVLSGIYAAIKFACEKRKRACTQVFQKNSAAMEGQASRIVLSFDDGRADSYRIAKDILLRRKIPATFYIATAYVDNSITTIGDPSYSPGMDVEEVVELYQCGFEIAGHADQHNNLLPDIREGLRKLRSWLNEESLENIGFASPHSELDRHDLKAFKDVFADMGITYVRTGVKNPKEPLHRCIRKAAQITKSVRLYQIGFGNSLGRIGEGYLIYSIPVLHKAALEQVQGLVRMAVHQKKDCVFMFHSILKKGEPYYEDTWSWDADDFTALCDWLLDMEKKGDIRMMSAMEAFQESKTARSAI